MSSGQQAKEFILSRSALNQAELARLIDWERTSFNQWLKGNRPIPNDKEKKLLDVLKSYGYNE